MIIEKEVESVIRDSHHQQVYLIEKKVNVTLRKALKIWPEFIEICERRNLLAHTDGIVSTQYLAVCREHNVDLKVIEVGRRLSINTKYYERAVSVIFELGIKLTQVVWRKLAPSEIGVAADELNELAYRLIVKEKVY